jgi:hypothetical protein
MVYKTGYEFAGHIVAGERLKRQKVTDDFKEKPD